ncbi:MAG: HAD family hydrolase [Candidatus Omnitrophica bacterium]|nr:HAD family hydrolase [Candidatus Omnitrophota bacterium]
MMSNKDKYVFIDRDGVINKDPGGWTEYGYVTRPEDFYILPNVPEAMKKLKEAGYKVIIVSNQQGVGKGYFTKEELADVTQKMMGDIRKAGGDISGTFYCTHRKDENCDCRKPKEGLFHLAQEELGMQSFDNKFFIGDNTTDIEAGKKAGLKTILVLSGKSTAMDPEKWEHKPDYICEDLLEAVEVVLAEDEKA